HPTHKTKKKKFEIHYGRFTAGLPLAPKGSLQTTQEFSTPNVPDLIKKNHACFNCSFTFSTTLKVRIKKNLIRGKNAFKKKR
ncbi:MAG: hypothetical protein Q7K34_03415, partial [archaeon]|nr:hypothetical protein [archaeon]